MATFIEPLYKLAVLDSMSGIGCLRRRFRNLTTYVDRARGKGSHLADAAPCADIHSTVLPSLQADVFDALELDPEETSATLPAPGGAANAVRMERAAAARQARDPRSLVLTTATATFGSPTVRQTSAPSAVDRRKRDEVAWGAVRGGRCWHQPACRPRPRNPTWLQRRAFRQGRRQARRFCLCWRGAAGAVGWRRPADD